MSLVMVVYVGVLVILLVAGFAVAVMRQDGFSPAWIVVVAAVAGLLFMPSRLDRFDDGPWEQTIVEVRPLAALSNVTTIKPARACIGRGSPRRTPTKSSSPTRTAPYTPERIDAAGVRIVEVADPSDARIEVARCERTGDRDVLMLGQGCGQPVTTVHVPTGSTARDYTIDPARG